MRTGAADQREETGGESEERHFSKRPTEGANLKKMCRSGVVVMREGCVEEGSWVGGVPNPLHTFSHHSPTLYLLNLHSPPPPPSLNTSSSSFTLLYSPPPPPPLFLLPLLRVDIPKGTKPA
ncbi:hypothetical protein Pmani_032097 [Petrolisthes manimaculis]|uniref:Uncharacterized protein n=1 Tax=Petrolisthes manimaculis TaxID=1843537 RepID=A0AAE1NTR9_9EUCA|nr:hypothetical protein Pmani_032097 [Petrolisthes manimaculis]